MVKEDRYCADTGTRPSSAPWAWAFDQIRHFGASNPGIVRKLLEVLTRLAFLVPPPRRAVVLAQAEAVLQDARARIESTVDCARIEQTAHRLLAGHN